MNNKSLALKIARSVTAYSFSSIQCQLPYDIANEIYEWGLKNIPEEDLSPEEKGRETDIHITLKYGLHNSDFTEARNLLIGKGPIEATLGPISLFNSDKYDVVKIDISSPILKSLNSIVRETMPNTETHDVYVPHCTIAYVNKGAGDRLVGCKDFEGRKVLLNSVLFSGHDNRRTILNI